MPRAKMPPLELWGGVECTVNRVGDGYRDQTRLTGHQERPADLDSFARLGISKLRYPVLWERVAPEDPNVFDWRWSDERLARIKRLGMEPMVGLVHHGSGPRYTSLIADDFAPLLEWYAAAVAARYPDVIDWTPVNEPLTTARFSALYGHWYPHARDERLFWHALLNQIDATRGAMRAIRRVNPAARLIQTEDLGRCYSTPEVAKVAEHYNHRRWMTWDLLCGQVVPGHELWPHLARMGFGERLRAIADAPCPPDVLGVNHYITSDRFLDDRAEAHEAPMPEVGYHDVTAARVLDPPPAGLAGVLREAWERYGRPLAVTECHLSCTREEQVRWLGQAWQICRGVRREGVEIQALTAWALLGSVDWASLLTREDGHYEPGALDVRGQKPRQTAVGALIASLGQTGTAPAGVTAVRDGVGWWQRDLRLQHAVHRWPEAARRPEPTAQTQPLLIVGATGTLGRMLACVCEARGLSYIATDRAALPLENPARMAGALDRHRPWAVINAAGWVRVDEAEDHADACHAANAEGAAALAAACAARGIHYTLFSSDLVFDGSQPAYDEASVTAPLGVYGASKAAAERYVAGCRGRSLVVRTAAFFSPHDAYNFAMGVEEALRRGRPFLASADHVVTPTYVPDLAQAVLDLVVDEATGTWHLTSGEALTWHAFGQRVADALRLDRELIEPADAHALGWRAPRPRSAALVSTKGALLPSLDDALARHAEARRAVSQVSERRAA